MKPLSELPPRLPPERSSMKKNKIYMVQFKSVFKPDKWIDFGDRGHLDRTEAEQEAKTLSTVNPNVRIVQRETIEAEL